MHLSPGHDDGADGSAGAEGSAARVALADRGQFVGGIVGSNLIALGQYRVVEDGLEKVVEPAS